jgi:carboxyl-terminal processing protease
MRKLILLAFLYLAVTACSKKSNPDPDDDNNNGNLTAEQIRFRKIIDTSAAYSHQLYLWTSKLPENYSYSHNDLNSFMRWIRNYSIEPGFSGPVDRWSFAVVKSEWDNVSGGIAGDFGLDIFYLSNNDLRIRNVDRNGPAATKGLKRGYRITEINGSTNVAYSNVNAVVNAIYNSSSVNLKVIDELSNTTTVSISATTYTQNPFALDSVYSINGKKIGYLVYNSFLGDTTQAMNKFATVFNKFANENIDNLVIDFRYNGGGYTKLSNDLLQYLVPSGHNGEVLTKDIFSEYFRDWDTTVAVKKKGSLNLTDLYVITGANTASASEAVINSIKPYLNVKLIGDTTHGKPVGYFAVSVADYYIFPVSIRTINKAGSGNYFDGFAPNYLAYDGVDYNWGNVNENCFKKAIELITGSGSGTRVNNADQARIAANMNLFNQKLSKENPYGNVRELDNNKLQQLRSAIEIKQ